MNYHYVPTTATGQGHGHLPIQGHPIESQQMGSLRSTTTAVRTHFYPEGGWGWIVCACAFLAHVTTSGAQLSAGALHIVVANKFQDSRNAHWLGPFSWSVSSMCSPLVVNLCRRKNVRVVSVVGGCLFPLSLLFTSFATELHQIFFCFGLMGGIGSCLVRESSTIVLGEYFRRRRQFAEQVVLAGTGVGVTLFSLLYLSLSRHIEWSQGFQIGAGLSLISAILPAFYRAAAYYHPQRSIIQQLKQQKAQRPTCSSFFVPLRSDICKSLKLFCIPSLKPVLWSAGISSFGLYAPAFLMSDFGKSEGLTGGSLLLLQTHLGLGLSLGVILGAILTLKKFRCCHISPRMLCCSTGILTGLSMIAISSVKGYYGYSLSAWIYGIALGSYIYTLKILCMDLTRTKHWERIWSCIQSLMGPGALIGTGLTSYLGKSSFYACATCVLLGSGIIGMELIDLSKCGSPQLSSEDNESPIPPAPAPPLILQNKYGQPISSAALAPTTVIPSSSFGFHPLRRSMSLQQPIYPYYSEHLSEFNQPYLPSSSYSPFCADCNPSLLGHPTSAVATTGFYPPQMVRSFSQPQFRNTGTQTQPSSPSAAARHVMIQQHQQQQLQPYFHHQRIRLGEQPAQSSSSFDQIPLHIHHHPRHLQGSHVHLQQQQLQQPTKQQRVPATTTSTLGKSSQKYSVMFASNPQLFPEHVHIPQIHNQQQQQADKLESSRIKSTTSSARSSTERFPDIPIEPQFGHFAPHQNQEPAFTRHYFDSSQMLPPHKRKEKELQDQKILQRQKQQQATNISSNTTSTSQNHKTSTRFNPAGDYQVHQNSISHSQNSNPIMPMPPPSAALPPQTGRQGRNSSILQNQQQPSQDSILNPNRLAYNPIIQMAQPTPQQHQHQQYYSGIVHQRSSSSGSNQILINPQLQQQPFQPQGILNYYNNESRKVYPSSSSNSHHIRRNSFNTHQRLPPASASATTTTTAENSHHHHHPHHHKSKKEKISSYEFDIEEPRFHSLRKPNQQQQQKVSTISTPSVGNNGEAGGREYTIGLDGYGILPVQAYYTNTSGNMAGSSNVYQINAQQGSSTSASAAALQQQQQQSSTRRQNHHQEFDT